ALGNKEIEANYEKALDTLGYRLSQYLKAVYKPNILKKTRFTYPLKRLELDERQPAIENTYYIDGYNFSTEDSILIIDDIYTSGATINEIIRALKVNNPKISIFFFTLGKTSFQFDMNENISLPYYIDKRNIDLFEEALVEYF
ncbi:MAG TPA: hypothetical protein VNW06_05355, partial [Cytophagaceae bacterium]|nr:hypothetical protein [Cytophagaceae bacterium]